MRAPLSILLVLTVLLAACGGDPPTTPEPTVFPLDIRFVNESDDKLVVAGIKARILPPGAEVALEVSQNWSQPAPGAEMLLADLEDVPIETEVQVWYLVLAFWTPEEIDASWRAWTTEPGIVRKAGDATLILNWPDGRWDLTEVPWLTSEDDLETVSKP